MSDTDISIEVAPYPYDVESFTSSAAQYFATNEEYRGYEQLVELAQSLNVGSHSLYHASCQGVSAGLAAVEYTDHVIHFNIFVVAPDFREVGIGDALFNFILADERHNDATAYESYALPGDRHTKNFFETRKGKARLLIVRGTIGK